MQRAGRHRRIRVRITGRREPTGRKSDSGRRPPPFLRDVQGAFYVYFTSELGLPGAGSQNNLNKETVYDLIQGHGRTDMYLHYATAIGDYERVIEHWILEDEWVKAIDIISRQVCYIFQPGMRYRR